METIISLLNQTPGLSAWKLRTVEEQTQELYFVGKNLETNRATDTVSGQVTVYVDRDGKRGAASFSVYDYMTEAELQKKISDGMYAASFAMNPYYDLPAPAENQTCGAAAGNGAEAELLRKFRDGREILDAVSDAVFAADVFAHGSLNATEFFLHVTSERVRNSCGVDVSSTACRGEIELIPSWEEDGEEAEVYRMLYFTVPDTDAITAQVREELQMAGDRFHARDLQEVLGDRLREPLKIIVQDEETAEIMDYFRSDLDYKTCYEKSNLFEPGDHVQGVACTGTVLNMKAVPAYPGALASRPFDSDGLMLRETVLVKDGIAVGRCGSSRFGQYLGEAQPAGNLPVVVVQEGTKSFAEMQQEPYLRCVKFSGIQVERTSGYFGGEVRLGYYFDGEKEIPVTGFSVSGDLRQARGSMVYSSDTVTLRGYHGPRYLEIRGMTMNA